MLPLDDRGSARLAIAKPPVPGAVEGNKTFTYYEGAIRIAEPAAPPMKNRSWTLTAKVKTEGTDTEGVIMDFGGVAAGMVLYLDGGVPAFDYNLFEDHTVVRGTEPLPAGEAVITLDFAYQGADGEAGKGAEITLSVNGTEVATGSMESTVARRFGIDTFGIGEDSGQPVSNVYEVPYPFTGEIERVMVEVEWQGIVKECRSLHGREQQNQLRQLMDHAEAGRKPPKVQTETDMPDELAEALDADPKLAEAFHALTLGRQRSYMFNLGQTKQSATRVARIEKFRDKIIAGKDHRRQGRVGALGASLRGCPFRLQ